MNRQQAKNMLPIIQALAEGKHIQLKDIIGNWKDIDFINLELCDPNVYRIKPEPRYRPFKNAEECWQEMQKHKPFGWIKKIRGNCNFLHIIKLYPVGIVINDFDGFGGLKNLLKSYIFAFVETTFADGTPFGIKEE